MLIPTPRVVCRTLVYAALYGVALGSLAGAEVNASGAPAWTGYDLFGRTNLVAWCIVPFDGRKRGPEERAAMLERLGIKSFAMITAPSISRPSMRKWMHCKGITFGCWRGGFRRN